MKKYLPTLLLCLLAFAASAQSRAWLDVGAKGAFNSTWLLNSNLGKDRNISYDFSFGHAGGIKIGFNFNEVHEITVDLMLSTLTQKYHSTGLLTKLSSEMTLQYLDIPLLYRNNKDGTYIEIGPQYSILLTGKASSTQNGAESSVGSSGFSPRNFGAVFGFGSYICGTDNLYLCLGMRFVYGFTDVISEEGGKGKDYHYQDVTNTQTAAYTSTHFLYGGLLLELNYDLGYIARSTCNKRKVLFF